MVAVWLKNIPWLIWIGAGLVMSSSWSFGVILLGVACMLLSWAGNVQATILQAMQDKNEEMQQMIDQLRGEENGYHYTPN